MRSTTSCNCYSTSSPYHKSTFLTCFMAITKDVWSATYRVISCLYGLTPTQTSLNWSVWELIPSCLGNKRLMFRMFRCWPFRPFLQCFFITYETCIRYSILQRYTFSSTGKEQIVKSQILIVICLIVI